MIEAYSDRLLNMGRELRDMRVDMYESLHEDEDWGILKPYSKTLQISLGVWLYW